MDGEKKRRLKVICTSSPLINLSNIDRLDLLESLYKQVIIPKAVYDEIIIKGKQDSQKLSKLITGEILRVQKVLNTSLIKALNKDLDYGESEVIALALEIKSDLIIIDETDARRIASMYVLNKTGFIGILIKAKYQGHLNLVKPYLDLAVNKGFRIHKNLYNQVLKAIGE